MSLSRILASPTLKLGIIGFLVLLLLIPMALVDNLRAEREQRRDGVEAEIGQSVGGTQTVYAPLVRVPFIEDQFDTEGRRVGQVETAWLFAARDAAIVGKLDLERRRRGIFEVPVFIAEHQVKGGFAFAPSVWRSIPGRPDLTRAELLVPVSAARALRRIEATLDGVPLTLTSSAERVGSVAAFAAPITDFSFERTYPFQLALTASGAHAIDFVPLSGNTEVRLEAPWPHPAFHGGFLPATRDIAETGFIAHWQVLSFNREIPTHWMARTNLDPALSTNTFGVRLVQPVDVYFLNHRSAKYGFLFLVLTFGAFFLFETIGRSRVHPIQYLLIGAALAVFYLVLLACSEHLGFGLSYLIAATSMGAMISAYTWSVMRSARRALVIGSWLALLYGALYVMINLEDVALLMGAGLTALVLALAMFLTRRVDWSGDAAETQPTSGSAPV